MTTTPLSSGTYSDQTVASGNTLDVLNGATVIDTTVSGGGTLIIEAGAFDSGATISAGGSETVLGSASSGTIDGMVMVSAATAVVTSETVNAGGTLELALAGTVASNTVVNNGGSLIISGRGDAINTTLNSGATLELESPKATLSGALVFDGPAKLEVTARISGVSAGSAFGDQATISGFGVDDEITESSAVVGGGATLSFTTSGDILTAIVSSGGVTQDYLFTGITSNHISGVANPTTSGFDLVYVACYAEGTLIRTDSGERPVEALRPGDLVMTVGGTLEPVRWLGRRRYAGRALAGRRHLQPVRIKAEALAPATPSRDLLVSPLHAILIDGVLVAAKDLINDITIVHETVEEVSYVHVELDHHEVIWAEGAPSETFVDDDNRFVFQSGEGTPISTPQIASYCAPRVGEGHALEAIRRRLLRRAHLMRA